MSELKKCYCDYITPQSLATKSFQTLLNVHEVCSSSRLVNLILSLKDGNI